MDQVTSFSDSPLSGHPGALPCEHCGLDTCNAENAYGEFICDDCQSNADERAYERYCEAFHDGGATSFVSLQDQQIAAWRLK